MKPYLILLISFAVLLGCATRQSIRIETAETDSGEDSVSYELIVFDPGFESWFLKNHKPSQFRSQSYYEYWNRRYVQAWNYHETGFRHRQLIDGYINYDSNTDYGPEINHKLFYYFMYVEHALKIPIIPDGPRIY
ncbi:DUF6146 family protein [Gaoshiqia sp. Z1-71]|uniref:DUF6146 family protein n=1 Tax=Gaoshiqia hydrogeniformans TaxID=3290090 RepID=UPI003BF8AACD